MNRAGLAIVPLLLAAAIGIPCHAQAQAQAPASAPAQPAQQPQPAAAIGYVKTVTGDAWVTTGGQQVKAAAGTPVRVGSRLRTAAGASMGVTLKDNTVLSFGPDTEFVLDAFAFDPAKGQLGLATSLFHGTLSYISGVIARLRPESVSVKTPTGLIGVRGTEFAVRVEVPR